MKVEGLKAIVETLEEAGIVRVTRHHDGTRTYSYLGEDDDE